jgi:hypothetical protein
MKVYRRMEVMLDTLLALALDVNEWSVSHPGCFTLRKAPGTHWIDWVGLRDSLDAVEKRKISCSIQFLRYPSTSSISLVLRRLSYSGSLVPLLELIMLTTDDVTYCL